jgi:hypothetical protein
MNRVGLLMVQSVVRAEGQGVGTGGYHDATHFFGVLLKSLLLEGDGLG